MEPNSAVITLSVLNIKDNLPGSSKKKIFGSSNSSKAVEISVKYHTEESSTALECDQWVDMIKKSIEYCNKSKIRVSGQLSGTIIKGRNFTPKDINGLADPYAITRIERQQMRTQTVYKSLNPTWNESFTFDISKHEGYFYFLIWDEDKFKTADFMGKVTIPLTHLTPNEEVKLWLPLVPRNSHQKVSGDILVRLKYSYSQEDQDLVTSPIFCQSLESLKTRTEICTNSIPTILFQLVEDLEKRALQEEGIFRVCGNQLEIKSLKNQINNGQPIPNGINIHSIAGVFKLFFRELPEPLLTFASKIGDSKSIVNQLVEILKTLPESHIQVLQLILPFFQKVCENSKINMMNNSNLSIVFGPSFLRTKVETPQTVFQMVETNDITKSIFENSAQILKMLSTPSLSKSIDGSKI
eukprot:gene7793-9592_t